MTRVLQTKLFTFWLLTLVSLTGVLKAQNITTYTFAQTNTEYKQVGLGATLTSAGCYDDANFATITIPFSFTYHGTAYTTINANQNGYARLGAIGTLGSNYSAMTSTPDVLSPLNADLYGCVANGADFTYTTTGCSPNRVFTLQWAKWGIYSSGLNEFSFQIKLYETSNKIQFCYGPSPGTNSTTPYVGLTGAAIADFQGRNTAANWSATTAAATLATSTCSVTAAIRPTNGLVFTWASAATVAGMAFTQSTAPFVPIQAASASTSYTCSGTWDDAGFSPVATIPFTFTYHGAPFTTVGIGPNGYAQLGAAAAVSLGYSAINTYTNVLSPLNADLKGDVAVNADCSYSVVGTAPNRSFVMQWSNWGFYNTNLNEVSFQIRLNETSNTIQYIYGPAPGTNIRTTYVGLNGATTADMQGRATNSNWAATTAAVTPAASICEITAAVRPVNGLTFTWAPPIGLPPTITSFTPSSGCANSTPVVITGTNFTGASSVTFGGTAALSFVVNSPTQITATPAAGTTGTITIMTPGGSVTSAGTFTVNSNPSVTVTASVNPICPGGSTVLTAVGANMGAGGVDQSQLTNNTCMANFSQTGMAQSFIPAVNTICGAGVFLTANGSGSGTVTIQLYSNLPNAGGVLLATGSVVVTDGNWADVTWASVPVTIGTTYYLVLTSTNGSQCVAGNTGGGYANGQVYANAGYSPFPSFDYTFRTTTCGGGGSYLYNPGGLSGAVQTVSPAVTTTYTVTATSALGCTATSTITVTISALPGIATVTATPPAICPGGTSNLAVAAPALNYCQPVYTNGTGFGDYVSLVTIPTTTLNNTTAGAAAPYYTLYPASGATTATLTAGSTYTLTLSAGTYTVNDLAAWIDYNNNGTLNDASEKLGETDNLGASPATTSFIFTVPLSAINGQVRLRVRDIDHATLNDMDPCLAQSTFGETEDYILTIVGGANGTTYGWSPVTVPATGANVAATPAATTTYTVTATNGAGCTSTSTVTVTVNPNPTVTASAAPASICPGGSTVLTPGGANTYVWNPGGLTGTPTVSPVATTTYTVTGTAASGCTATSTVTVNVNAAPPTPVASSSPATICEGGTSQLTATNLPVANMAVFTEPFANNSQGWTLGTEWAIGPTLVSACPTFNQDPASDHTPTADNGVAGVVLGGCATTTIHAPYYLTSPVINLAGLTNVNLNFWRWLNSDYTPFMQNYIDVWNGTTWVNIWVSGPSPGIAENAWSLQTYNVTPYVNANFQVRFGKSVGAGGAFTISSWNIDDLTITADAPSAVQWTGPAVIANPANATTNVTPGVTGISTYTVTVTNGAGCTASSTTTVTVNPNPTVTASASANPICAGGSTTLTGGGAASYVWNPGALAGSPTVNPVVTTTYTVTGTNVSGCTATSTVTVTVNPSPAVTASASPGAICPGASSVLTGGGAASYAWNPGALVGSPTVTPVATTSYTVTGTDINGCTATSVATVTVNPTPAVTASASPGAICPGASSVLTGAGAASYAWNPGALVGSPTVTPAATTSYTVTGTDVNGCTATSVATVTVNPTPAVTASASPSAICIGGSAVLTGNGATSYTWNPGALVGSPTVTPIATTNYTVTGTDANGCTATSTVDVVVNGLPTVTASPVTQTVCENGMATVSGGGAATYTWTGGITDATPFMVMAPATYTVTGTDANGCTNTATAEVLMNAAPLVSASATPNTTCNMTSVTPNATGANSYVWTGGLMNGVPFVAMGTATYTVTGTNGAGCTATSTVTVTVNPASGVLAPATSNQSQDHGDDFNINYYDGSCDLIATVDDGAAGNILGLTTSTVNVDATVGFHNGQPFVRRWYQITPTSNGSADVILYINQSDFDDYNAAVVAPYLSLPTSGNNADPNVANIRITKNDNAGLGNNPVVITPTVNWNGTYWELSFNTPSFSQFRVHSVNPGNVPLPATVINFTGTKLESSDKLSWTTASEQNNAYFNLQHSTDGISFRTIAKVNSKAANGNSTATLNYTSVNDKPALGHNYYRLQQVDIDQKVSVHAQIVDLIWGANGSSVSIYPNPTTDILNVDLYTAKAENTTVKLLDMSGRVVKQIQAKSVIGMNNIQLSMGEIASGLYTIQVYENNTLTHTSKVRKND